MDFERLNFPTILVAMFQALGIRRKENKCD
jgi:hypothetical protein